MATKPKAKKESNPTFKSKQVSRGRPGLQSGRDGSSGYPGYLGGSKPTDKIMSESKKMIGSDGPILGKKTLVRSGEKSSKTYIQSEKQKDGSQIYFDKGNNKATQLKELKKQQAKRKK